MNTTKILLDDRQALANNVIKELSQTFENGQKMLSLLKEIGIDKTELTDWAEIETICKANFPNATIQFNIEANGIEKQYRDAEEFYRKNKGALSFEPMSEQEKENERENLRIYATTDNQIEAHALILQTIDNFNRLQELGVNLDYSNAHFLNKVFSYDYRKEVKMEVYKPNLISLITELK